MLRSGQQRGHHAHLEGDAPSMQCKERSKRMGVWLYLLKGARRALCAVTALRRRRSTITPRMLEDGIVQGELLKGAGEIQRSS